MVHISQVVNKQMSGQLFPPQARNSTNSISDNTYSGSHRGVFKLIESIIHQWIFNRSIRLSRTLPDFAKGSRHINVYCHHVIKKGVYRSLLLITSSTVLHNTKITAIDLQLLASNSSPFLKKGGCFFENLLHISFSPSPKLGIAVKRARDFSKSRRARTAASRCRAAACAPCTWARVPGAGRGAWPGAGAARGAGPSSRPGSVGAWRAGTAATRRIYSTGSSQLTLYVCFVLSIDYPLLLKINIISCGIPKHKLSIYQQSQKMIADGIRSLNRLLLLLSLPSRYISSIWPFPFILLKETQHL